MAPAGPRGSRRRFAPPHHEGLKDRRAGKGDLSAVAQRAKAEACPPFQLTTGDAWSARRKSAFAHPTKSVQSNLSGFPAEHRLFARDAPVIAGQRAALAERAVAGHHERHRI